MLPFINQISNNHKGLLMIIGGFVLLFHTLGIIQTGLNAIIIIGSILLILTGFLKAEYHKKILAILQSTEKND